MNYLLSSDPDQTLNFKNLPVNVPKIQQNSTDKAYIPGLWIRIRMDPHSFSLLDPDPGG